jgi:hypothetical protein
MRLHTDKKPGRRRAARGAVALPQALTGSLDVDIVVAKRKRSITSAAQGDLFGSAEPHR